MGRARSNLTVSISHSKTPKVTRSQPYLKWNELMEQFLEDISIRRSPADDDDEFEIFKMWWLNSNHWIFPLSSRRWRYAYAEKTLAWRGVVGRWVPQAGGCCFCVIMFDLVSIAQLWTTCISIDFRGWDDDLTSYDMVDLMRGWNRAWYLCETVREWLGRCCAAKLGLTQVRKKSQEFEWIDFF